MPVKNLIMPKIESSFLVCEKDFETILRKLFIESKPHSDILKKLLVINTKDCLDAESNVYQDIIDKTTLATLRRDGYIKLEPKITLEESSEVKAYIIITFDNFATNASNPQFRDHIVNFDIICNVDYWDIGNYRLRPLKIAGYIDGILNNTRLAGIGTFQFLGCNELILSENFSGYTLMYQAINMTEDIIPE